MSTAIYCETKREACATPFACLQTCKATCPPCTGNCNQGRNCSSLTTGNGGNVIAKGWPAPVRPRQYEPDFEIEHTRVSYPLSPFGYVVAICAVLMFVIYVVRHA